MIVEPRQPATMSARLDLTILDTTGRHGRKAPVRTARIMALFPSRRLSVPCTFQRQVRMSKITRDKFSDFSAFSSQNRRIFTNLGVVI